MEPNVPVAKRMWKLVQVVLFMLRKGVSRRKLMLDLNTLLKRGKNLVFHHGGGHGAGDGGRKEYEFSCSNTPTKYYHFFPSKKKHGCRTADDDMDAVRAVLEILNSGAGEKKGTECDPLTEPSTPYLLPGFGRTPLRITESPFPLTEENGDDGYSSHVDKAAEEFIQKVRRNLRKQKKTIDCN